MIIKYENKPYLILKDNVDLVLGNEHFSVTCKNVFKCLGNNKIYYFLFNDVINQYMQWNKNNCTWELEKRMYTFTVFV